MDIKCVRCGKEQAPKEFETNFKRRGAPAISKTCLTCRERRAYKPKGTHVTRKQKQITKDGELNRIMAAWTRPKA